MNGLDANDGDEMLECNYNDLKSHWKNVFLKEGGGEEI